MNFPLVKAHRILAAGLGIFIISHLIIHLMAIAGAEVHIVVLESSQWLYRNWLIEPLLVIAIIGQICVGAKLLWRRWKQPQKGFWGWAQILSGGYLAFFLIIHSSAALSTRYITGLDTNFYWAASTLNIYPLQYFFIPYYFFGILSVFLHLAAVVFFRWADKGVVVSRSILALGIVIALLIPATFSGAFYDIDLPLKYIEYFENYVP